MTRPRKAPTPPSGGRGKYTSPILVGLTEEQRDAIKAAAARDHRTLADWARLVLLRAAGVEP